MSMSRLGENLSKVFIFALLVSFLLPLFVFASEDNVVLDYVAVNNEVVSASEGVYTVRNNDVVKIAGKGVPDTEVNLTFSDNTYTAKVDNNGNWFVLFSILSQEDKSLPVKLLQSDPVNDEKLLILRVESSISEENNQRDYTREKGFSFIYLLLISLSLLTLLASFLFKEKRKNRKHTKGK